MVGLEHRIWTIQAQWYVHEERAAVWDFVLTTRSLISKQYQIKNPGLRIFWTTYGVQCWFTIPDMSKAYHQGYIHKALGKFTAFLTPLSLYKWLKIPFGLTNAPSCFQRYINKWLAALQDIICVTYLDDVLIYGRTFVEHVKNVENLLQRLREHGIKSNLAKCNFFKREVIYQGRPISKDGYHPDTQNNDTFEKFRTPPKIISKLRFLLGFLGYSWAYMKNFFRTINLFMTYLLLQSRKMEVLILSNL